MSSDKLPKTKQLLLEMFSDIDFFIQHGRGYQNLGRSTATMRELKELRDAAELRQTLYRLKKQKLIKRKKEGNHMLSFLTENGAIELLKARIATATKAMPEGQICFVIFDIPEDIRNVRVAFRSLLKSINFRMTQRSVWEGDLDVIDDLRDLIKLMKAEKYIRIYHALDIRQ